MLNFENYRLIKEQNESLNETINGQHTNECIESVDEALGTIAAVAGGATALVGLAGLLIAKRKLKKLGKEYQNALVQQKLNDIDFQKKVQAHAEKGNKLSPEQKETLKAANKAKNDALRDEASEVAGKMDDLGKSNDVIKKLVTVVKRKAKIAALEVVVKNADNEENKQAAIEQLDGAKKELKDGLRDYESAEKEAEKDPNWDNVKDKDKGEGDKGNGDKGNGDKGEGDKEPNKNSKPEDNTDTETKEKQIKNLEENVEKAKTAYEAQKELAAEEGADDEKKKKAIELEIKYLKAKKALAEVKEESTDDLDKEIANKEEELSTYGMSPEQKEKIKNIKNELKELNNKYTQAKEGLGDGKDEKNSKKCLEAKKAKLEKEKEMAEVKEDKETIDKLTEEISKLEKELQRTDLED